MLKTIDDHSKASAYLSNLSRSKHPFYLVLILSCLLVSCSDSGDESAQSSANLETSEIGESAEAGEASGTIDTNAPVNSTSVTSVTIPLPRNGELTTKRLIKEFWQVEGLSGAYSNQTWNYVYEDEKIVQIKRLEPSLFDKVDEKTTNFEYEDQLLSRVWQESRNWYGDFWSDSYDEYSLIYDSEQLVEINALSRRGTTGNTDTIESADTETDRREYRYNDMGQIVGSIGPDYLYFRDCGVTLPPPSYIPVFSLTYDDQNKLLSAETEDQLYRVKFEYDSIGRMNSISSGFVCEPDSGPAAYDNFVSISYNEKNQVIRVDKSDWYPGEEANPVTNRYTYNENGLLIQESREAPGYSDTVRVYSYDDDGYLIKNESFSRNSGSTELIGPKSVRTYEYENEPCRVSYSANKAKLMMMEIYWTYYIYAILN